MATTQSLQSNQVESDLTELSWLTTNVQFFSSSNSSSMDDLSLSSPQHLRQQPIFPHLKHYEVINLNQKPPIVPVVKMSPELADDELSYSSSSSSSTLSIMSSLSHSSPSSKKPLLHTTKRTINAFRSQVKTASQHVPASDDNLKQISEESDTPQCRNVCGNNKPQLTLSCLIFMALQESKDKCLPVREIYEWIEENFPFYKHVSNGGWKSSIRHNLSFSKCFKKMDRTESVLYRDVPKKFKEPFSSLIINSENNLNGRKRRAPNTTGTCWTVSNECKTYLIQTLQKSSFWFHNSKYYSNLNTFINEYTNKLAAGFRTHSDDETENILRQEFEKCLKTKKCTLAEKSSLVYGNKKLKTTTASSERNRVADEELDSEEDKQNLFKFVQKQQEELNLINCQSSYIQSDTRGSLDLSLSSSSSSLSSAFSMLASTRVSMEHDKNQAAVDAAALKLNSDLEMEVASALVDMKFNHFAQ